MSLTDDTRPQIAWDPVDRAQVSISIKCHCGEAFGIDELDAAQAHVAGHAADVDEPA